MPFHSSHFSFLFQKAMAKKRSASPSLRHSLWLVISISSFLFIFAILRLQYQPRHLPSARRPIVPFVGTPKIAFLFLARNNLPLDFLWQSFFQSADEDKFSVYIHSRPGFVFDESSTKCTFFYGRQLSKSVEVSWGESSMIKAEQLLLEVALQDHANQRFVLISDSCVPMYNFSYIYNYVMSSSKSFVDSFLDTKEGRYNPKMSPTIPKAKWRKGSQWITLVRRHAEIVVDDDLVFPIFNRYCKRRPPLNLDGKLNHRPSLLISCYLRRMWTAVIGWFDCPWVFLNNISRLFVERSWGSLSERYCGGVRFEGVGVRCLSWAHCIIEFSQIGLLLRMVWLVCDESFEDMPLGAC